MSDTPQIGDIYYRVFTGHGLPWVCRMRCKHISAKGQSIHFEALDTAKPKIDKYHASRILSKETVFLAVRDYQRTKVGFNVYDDPESHRLKLILLAEKLIPSETEYDSENVLDRACL